MNRLPLLLLLAACTSTPKTNPETVQALVSAGRAPIERRLKVQTIETEPPAAPGEYRIGVNDVLHIVVVGHPELAGSGQASQAGPVGTRVERTEDVTRRIEQTIQESLAQVRADDGSPVTRTVISTVGLPQGRTALFSGNTEPHSGQVQAYLVPHPRRSVTDEEAADKVRSALRDAIPGVQSYFFVGGIVKRILNFGAAAPIDIEIVGYDLEAGSAYAKRLLPRLRAVSR